MDRREFLEQTKYNVNVQRKKLTMIETYLKDKPNDAHALRKRQDLADSIRRGEDALFDLEQLEKLMPIEGMDVVWA